MAAADGFVCDTMDYYFIDLVFIRLLGELEDIVDGPLRTGSYFIHASYSLT